MKSAWLFDRFLRKLGRMHRRRVFYEATGQRANLVGDIVLINRNLKLGKNVTIYPYVQLFGDGLIEIGDNVDIGTGTIIYSSARGGVHIGSNSMIAAQCYLIDADHGTAAGVPIREQEGSVAPIWIGEDVWLAANVSVLKGSVIEDGAVVGAKALVKGNVPAGAICVGCPARVLRYRE